MAEIYQSEKTGPGKPLSFTALRNAIHTTILKDNAAAVYIISSCLTYRLSFGMTGPGAKLLDADYAVAAPKVIAQCEAALLAGLTAGIRAVLEETEKAILRGPHPLSPGAIDTVLAAFKVLRQYLLNPQVPGVASDK